MNLHMNSRLKNNVGMRTPTCPKCRRVRPPDDVNVSNDVAYCRGCNLANKLSELVEESELHVDLTNPPAGAWYRENGLSRTFGATHRSLGTAIGALLISLFWNGIVSIFVLIAIGSTLRHMGIPLPHWFPTPESNGQPMTVGMTIFLWIFLTPFIAIGLAMVGAFISAIGGHTEVRLYGSQGEIFHGFGQIGWHRRFEPADVTKIRLEEKRNTEGNNNRTYVVIELGSGKRLRFGSLLTEERRNFIASAIRQTLL